MAEAKAAGKLPLVVKVGGSLAETGRLSSVLGPIAAARIPVVVVPGGGPFADSVRNLQREMQFDDAVAHRLAMLAMHQMAELIVSREKRFTIAESLDEIAAALEAGQAPVWAPLRLMANDAAIPATWAATSDSLAARLAELLGGAPLALLKSVDVEEGVDAGELARRGVVDALFPAIVARAGLRWFIAGPRMDKRLHAILNGETPAGVDR